jgi:hypothetical protein
MLLSSVAAIEITSPIHDGGENVHLQIVYVVCPSYAPQSTIDHSTREDEETIYCLPFVKRRLVFEDLKSKLIFLFMVLGLIIKNKMAAHFHTSTQTIQWFISDSAQLTAIRRNLAGNYILA